MASMEHIVQTYRKFEVGSAENYARMQYPGFSTYLTAEELWVQATKPNGTVHDAEWAEGLGVFWLHSDVSMWQDMALTDVAYTYSNVGADELSASALAVGPRVKHLVYDRAESSTDVPPPLSPRYIRSHDTLIPNPSVYVSFVRPLDSKPGNTMDEEWSFSFGMSDWEDWTSGYGVIWDKRFDPIFFYPGGEKTCKMSPNERAAFLTATEVTWCFYTVYNRIVIQCSALPRIWTVYQPDGYAWTVPESPWYYQSEISAWAINVSAAQFSTEGYLETDWIEHGFYYDPDETSGAYWRVLPDIGDVSPTAALGNTLIDPTGDTSIKVEVIQEDWLDAYTPGTRKRYKVTLGGRNGKTPMPQAIQIVHLPTFLPAETPRWWDITPWFEEATEQYTLELGSQECIVQLRPFVEVDLPPTDAYGTPRPVPNEPQTLWSYLWGYSSGVDAFRYEIGYVKRDATSYVVSQRRMTGFVDIRDAKNELIDAEPMTMTAHNKWWMMSRVQLWFAPCVIDMRVTDALKLLLQFAGIPSDDITVVADPAGTRTTVRRQDYARPNWLPEFGANAADFIRQLCHSKGFRVEFDRDGKATIQQRTDPNWAYAPAYGTLPVGLPAPIDPANVFDEEHCLSTVEVVTDYSDVYNAVVVRGRQSQDPDADPIYCSLYDDRAWDVGTESYTVILAPLSINDENLIAEEDVNTAAMEQWVWRPWPLKAHVSSLYALWDGQPGGGFLLTDLTVNQVSRRARIQQVNTRITNKLITPLVVAELVE